MKQGYLFIILLYFLNMLYFSFLKFGFTSRTLKYQILEYQYLNSKCILSCPQFLKMPRKSNAPIVLALLNSMLIFLVTAFILSTLSYISLEICLKLEVLVHFLYVHLGITSVSLSLAHSLTHSSSCACILKIN